MGEQRDAFGVDFGTTRTGIAKLLADGKFLTMVENNIEGSELEKLMPSILVYEKGKKVVGRPAQRRRNNVNPQDFLHSLKRFRCRK